MRFKDFDIRELKFDGQISSARQLDALHYAETEAKYKGTPLAPNYDAMVAAEWAGQVAYFGAFDVLSGDLVAHLFYYLSKSNHSDSLNATEDRYFIVKKCRATGLARRLLQFAEKALKARGVTDIFMSSKYPIGGPHIDLFLETEGFRHVANVFHKEI